MEKFQAHRCWAVRHFSVFPFCGGCGRIEGKKGVKKLKTCVVFCAGEFDALLRPLGPEDYVIAADDGLRYAKKLGIRPDAVLGDFDSLGFTPEGANVFPAEKDDTDAMLAVKQGLKAGCREFLLYGSLDGPRLDHTVANFQLLQYLTRHGAYGYLVGKEYLVTVVENGEIRFPAGRQGIVSVFCMGADAGGVTLEGLHYPLTGGTLTAAFPLGVSNHFTEHPARIAVEDGSVLVLWDRVNGLPRRG